MHREIFRNLFGLVQKVLLVDELEVWFNQRGMNNNNNKEYQKKDVWYKE